MKDEIKEIKFIKYNGIEGYIELMKHDVEPLNNPDCKRIDLYYDGKDIKAVLDYITNLQEENEYLKKHQRFYKKFGNDYIFCLVGDKETYKDYIFELQERIENAIDYINQEIKNMPLNGCKQRLNKINKILQGVDKDE